LYYSKTSSGSLHNSITRPETGPIPRVITRPEDRQGRHHEWLLAGHPFRDYFSADEYEFVLPDPTDPASQEATAQLNQKGLGRLTSDLTALLLVESGSPAGRVEATNALYLHDPANDAIGGLLIFLNEPHWKSTVVLPKEFAREFIESTPWLQQWIRESLPLTAAAHRNYRAHCQNASLHFTGAAHPLSGTGVTADSQSPYR
jgi:hypothetical protein